MIIFNRNAMNVKIIGKLIQDKDSKWINWYSI